MSRLLILISIFISAAYPNFALSLDITVPVTIFEPLSKTSSNEIVGSSSTKILKEEIINFNNSSLQEIISLVSGINSRSIYGANTSGSKSTIDIRGMGAQAKSNVLILLNGQRLNNIDMSDIDFPSIPIQNIDMIEIHKGNAASVLYGDGAMGGSINIITNPSSKKENNYFTYKVGSFNKKNYTLNNSLKINQFSINTYLDYNETDGYRDENEQQQTNISSKIIIPGKKGQHFFSLDFNEQIMSTPGNRTQTELYIDRKGSSTPDDFINSIGGSILYGATTKVDQNTSFNFNSSYRQKHSYYDLQSSSYPSNGDTLITNLQISPRVEKLLKLYNKKINSTFGLDIQRADYVSFRKKSTNAIPLHEYKGDLHTQGLYIQNTINIFDGTKIGLGFRSQRNALKLKDKLNLNAPNYNSWDIEHDKHEKVEINHAYNFGIDKSLNKFTNIYSRYGNGFRFPNIDDRIGGSGGASFDLETQKSEDIEFGLKFQKDSLKFDSSLYLINARNELVYDSDAFVNMNINSTRRYGIELSVINKFNDLVKFKNNFTFAKAKYTSGDQGTYATDFKDKDVPLVPQYTYEGIMELDVNAFTKIIPTIKYKDDMRMESDDENFQDTKIPSHILFNLDIKQKFKFFYTSLSLNNMFNYKYHNYAVASSSTQGTYNAYPEPGPELMLSIGTNF